MATFFMEVEMKTGNTRKPVVLPPEKQRITVRKKYINYARSGPNTILSDVGAWKFRSRIPFTHTAKITTFSTWAIGEFGGIFVWYNAVNDHF